MKGEIFSVKLFVLFAVVLVATVASARNSMLFVYYNDYAPFGWEENGAMQGIYIDIVNELFVNRLKIPIEHRGYPWKRAQKMVQDGEADGYCTVITPGRLAFSEASHESIIDVNFKIFVSANSPKRKNLEHVTSISGLRGFQLVDYMGSGWAEQYLGKAGLNLYWLPRNYQLWSYLLAGRADATVKNEWTTRHILKKMGYLGQIVELPNPMMRKPTSFHILIGKKSPYRWVLDLVDETILEMKQDGTLKRIHDKYR